MNPGKMVYRLMIGTLTLVLVTVVMLTIVWVKLSADERKSCQLQSQGLPAGHELAASMRAIHTLLTLRPETRAQKLAARNETQRTKAVVSELNFHLQRFLDDEAQQPQHRAC